MTVHAVLFTGSREWKDLVTVRQAIIKYPPGSVMIHGAAAGLDLMAARIGEQAGWVVVGVPALWGPVSSGKMDRSAGPKRNALLVDLLLVFQKHGYTISAEAFPLGGPGTADCCARLVHAQVPLTEWKATG